MGLAHSRPEREPPESDDGHVILPLETADPTGLMQRAMAGLPTGIDSVDQLVLAWLMTLPATVPPAGAARCLLTVRRPCCCPVPERPAPDLLDLLRVVAASTWQQVR